jgi:hypothetical protein
MDIDRLYVTRRQPGSRRARPEGPTGAANLKPTPLPVSCDAGWLKSRWPGPAQPLRRLPSPSLDHDSNYYYESGYAMMILLNCMQ